MKTILTADWAPVIEAAVRRLAQLCTIVYVAGYMTGAWLHQLNDALAREWVAALGVLDRPAAPLDPRQAPLDPRQAPLDMAPAPLDPLPIVATTRHAMPTGITLAREWVAATVQRADHFGGVHKMVVAPVIATTRHAMPTGIDHARHLVAAGHSQRQAARRAGVSRTSLQRALAVA